MKYPVALIAFALALITGCGGTDLQSDEALAIANAYVEREFAEVNMSMMRASVTEDQLAWVVTYVPPPDSVGGGPTVRIEKSSGRVIAARGYQ